MAEARRALEAGQVGMAVDIVTASTHKFWYGKEPVRFKLLSDLYSLLEHPVDESAYRENPWQRKLMAELYETWPKLLLENAILKHDFPEVNPEERTVTGSESVRIAEYHRALSPTKLVAFSQGRRWLKLWDLESGEIVYGEDSQYLLKGWLGFLGIKDAIRLVASAIGRDSSHMLFSYYLVGGADCTTAFRETFRQVACLNAGTYEKSHYENVKYYTVRGEVVSILPERTVELDRKDFEMNPVRGEVLLPDFSWKHSKRYRDIVRGNYTKAEAEEIFKEDAREEEREKQIVRVRQYQTVILAHEEIEGYMPAGITAFVARGNEYFGLKVDDLSNGDRVWATLAVEDDESWLAEIIGPGHGLKQLHVRGGFTTSLTALCISSDGSLALANGCGETFHLANLWTGDCLRVFRGHTGRVTCLCLSVDVRFAVSGSEDMTVRLWEPITAECVRVFEGHESAVTKVCISLDGTKIFSADSEGFIKLWDIETGECLRTIEAHSNHVSDLRMTFDGKFAVSGSWDKTVKLWRLSDGLCMKTFEHEDWVTSVDLTPDGRYLVSSSYAGTKCWELIWRLEPREVVEWDEGARPLLEILMNANAAWDGKLGTPVDMTEEEKKNTLRRQGPSWTAWHTPSEKNDWHRIWHLNWDIEKTLGYAGYGWLSQGLEDEAGKVQEAWRLKNQAG